MFIGTSLFVQRQIIHSEQLPFGGSHLAVQVDAAHKTDNRQRYNRLPDRGLEKGPQKILKIAQDN